MPAHCVFGNTVRECMWGDAPRLPQENQWYPFWEQKHFHPDPAAPLENHVAIRLAVKGSGLIGDPDDPRWDTLTPAATANVIEAQFHRLRLAGRHLRIAHARGNIIGNNFLAAKQGIIRRSEEKPSGKKPAGPANQ